MTLVSERSNMLPRNVEIEYLVKAHSPHELAEQLLEERDIVDVLHKDNKSLKAELDTAKRLYQEVKDILIRLTDK